MVHRREIDGTPVVFGNQGDLWHNAMTWFDHDTGSVWSQPTGEAIMGPLTGERLELLPSTLSTWDDWRTLHPDTRALNVGSVPRGFEVGSTAVVAAVGDDSLAVPIRDLVDVGLEVVADRADHEVRFLVDRRGEVGGAGGLLDRLPETQQVT